MKEGPHLQGLPFFTALPSPLSVLAMPFSPLNYGSEGRGGGSGGVGEGEDQSYIGSLKYKKKCGEGIRQTERKH